MLKYLKNQCAQAVMGEYVLVIFLALAVVVSMSVYFKRAVQARIHDARDYMVGEVRERTAGEFEGNLFKEYEPYYTNISSVTTADADHTEVLLPGASSGIFGKSISELRSVLSVSETAPPREFNRTTPIN